MTTPVAALEPAVATPTRVLKRARLTMREEHNDQLAELRRAMDAEIACAVDERVAAIDATYRADQEAALIAAVEGAARSIDAATAALPIQLAHTVDRLADELVETAGALAEWLCAAGGAASASWTAGLSDRIVEALGQLTAHEAATVRINPADATALTETRHPMLSTVDLRPDPSLQPGEALIETASGDVDLTLRTALRRAVEIVTGRAAAALTDHRDPGKQRRSSDRDRRAPAVGRRRDETGTP